VVKAIKVIKANNTLP